MTRPCDCHECTKGINSIIVTGRKQQNALSVTIAFLYYSTWRAVLAHEVPCKNRVLW
jgi:hypothetical protein